MVSCAESACPDGYECVEGNLCRLEGSMISCADDGGGDPTGDELVDEGLITRYYLDEAAGGTAPERVRDSASSPLDLALHYGELASYAEDDRGNRGLHFDDVALDARASAPAQDSKFDEILDGSPTGTIEVVVMVGQAMEEFSRIAHIGAGSESGDFTLGAYSRTELAFAGAGLDLPERWNEDFNLVERSVLHVVFDAEQAEGRQLILYVDGEPYPSPHLFPAGALIDIAEGPDVHVVLGNREIGQRGFRGNLFYAAFYSDALSPDQVEHNADILDDDDDRD